MPQKDHEISCHVVIEIMTSQTEVQKSEMENQLEMTNSASYGLNSISRKDKSPVLEPLCQTEHEDSLQKSQKQESDRLKQMLIND